MTLDKRNYTKKRLGWGITKLTSFRRTARQIDDTQNDDLIEQSARYERKVRFFSAPAILAAAFFIWWYFLSGSTFLPSE